MLYFFRLKIILTFDKQINIADRNDFNKRILVTVKHYDQKLFALLFSVSFNKSKHDQIFI